MRSQDGEFESTDVAQLLTAAGADDRQAAATLLPLLYAELRHLARARLASLGPGQTLQPTALVHEAYLRLVGDADPGWNGRSHFFGAAAQAMRDIIVEHARYKSRIKRGGNVRRVEMPAELAQAEVTQLPFEEILLLDQALVRMQGDHPRPAQVVLLRYFGGLPNDLIAGVLKTSTRTIERDWRFARAWLHRAIHDNGGQDDSTSEATK